MTHAALRSSSDGLLVALAVTYGAALLLVPSIPLVALGLWWISNTVAHNFIHRSFFTRRWPNRVFSLLLSSLTGIPQTLWQQRHLAHHAGRDWRPRLNAMLIAEVATIAGLWLWLATSHPVIFAAQYLPGYALGLVLCALHGHYEHAGGTTSHYGRVYNLLFFNDGYHVEHHASPRRHWSELPSRRQPAARVSRWPAVCRWLEGGALQLLERAVLRSELLQRFVLDTHRRALAPLLRDLPDGAVIAIVGGGLFPRTALILRELRPSARLVIIDADGRHLAIARARLGEAVEFRHCRYPTSDGPDAFDLVIIPLSYQGDREALYRCLSARALAVHDWLWRRRGSSRVVSLLLLKRINLVCR